MQPPTPGVGLQGAPPVVEPLPQPDPVLFADIDPVLLVRLYPGATNTAELRAEAMKAGEAAKEQGAELVASQQEPVVIPGEEPPAQAPQYPQRPPQYPPPQGAQYPQQPYPPPQGAQYPQQP
jgi:hypothetical protein